MSGFSLGPFRLATSWRVLLHPEIRELQFAEVPDPGCTDCRMVRHRIFPAQLKCCDYTPTLPSFLVGEILTEGQSAGSAQTVQDWVRAGRGDPLFVNVSPRLVHLHRTTRSACPLLAPDGRCTIYEHRPYLCINYSCVKSADPNARGFLSCLASLLELLSSIAPQMLAAELGIDRERYTAAWEAEGDESRAWTDDDRLREDLAAELWQGRDPEDHYRRCYRRLLEGDGTMHLRAEQYRRGQRIRRLERGGPEARRRAAQISALPETLRPVAPSAEEQHALAEGPIRFGDNPWTLFEHQARLLWFHARWLA